MALDIRTGCEIKSAPRTRIAQLPYQSSVISACLGCDSANMKMSPVVHHCAVSPTTQISPHFLRRLRCSPRHPAPTHALRKRFASQVAWLALGSQTDVSPELSAEAPTLPITVNQKGMLTNLSISGDVFSGRTVPAKAFGADWGASPSLRSVEHNDSRLSRRVVAWRVIATGCTGARQSRRLAEYAPCAV